MGDDPDDAGWPALPPPTPRRCCRRGRAGLVSSNPVDGSTLAQPPSSITLTFNEEVQNLEPAVVITGPDGQTYPTSPPVVDSAVVHSTVTALGPPGTYTVAYRVTSVDGHPVSGQLQFQQDAPPIPATPEAVPSTAPAIATTAAPSAIAMTAAPPAIPASTGPRDVSKSSPATPSGQLTAPTSTTTGAQAISRIPAAGPV